MLIERAENDLVAVKKKVPLRKNESMFINVKIVIKHCKGHGSVLLNTVR